MLHTNAIKIILTSISTFLFAILITPFVTHFLYKYKLWKKTSVSKDISGGSATITQTIHSDEKRQVPRMGGVIVWSSVLFMTFLFYSLEYFFPNTKISSFSFLTRSQTWIPLSTLTGMSFVGLVDDYLVSRENENKGLSVRFRIALVGLSGIVIALWFYTKLGIQTIHLPFLTDIGLSLPIFVLFFIFVLISTYASGIIDGVDGLAGGVFAIIFAGYGIISFSSGLYDLSALCFAITGGLTAFLWFNIPPARFFLSDTGTMGLTTTLAVIAYLTNTVLFLPIIGFVLVITVLSDVIQIFSKKFRGGKKVFLVAPLHNHFQILGWPSYKVTMRYWIMTFMSTLLGVALVLLDKINK